MKMLSKNLLFVLWLLPIASLAGQINQIIFNDSTMTILHSNCQLKQPIQDKNAQKLIFPIVNCVGEKGTLHVVHPKLRKIHWAQHDTSTIWVVATFTKEYQYDISFSSNQIKVHFPIDYPRSSLEDHIILEKQSNNKLKNLRQN